MRIGVDFDNTIVNYDGVFYAAGRKLGWLPDTIATSKQAVKSFLIEHQNEHKWTELQGVVYGKEIMQAKLYEDVKWVLSEFKKRQYQLFLVSHKTKFPIIGEKYDFHNAANHFLQHHELLSLFESVQYCETKQRKISAIAELDLHWFIDDLSSVLLHSDFPEGTERLLFSPNMKVEFDYAQAANWQDVKRYIDYAVDQ